MKQLSLALALAGSCVLSLSAMTTTAVAGETYEDRAVATSAAYQARSQMMDTFGKDSLKPGQYVWRDDVPASAGDERVVVSLGDQMAYLYRGPEMVAAATISSGKPGKDTPSGVFSVLDKKTMGVSKKYDNAPMPFMQRIDNYGIALHAGYNPGTPASHGCVRLPKEFAKKLFSVTEVGTPVLIGA